MLQNIAVTSKVAMAETKSPADKLSKEFGRTKDSESFKQELGNKLSQPDKRDRLETADREKPNRVERDPQRSDVKAKKEEKPEQKEAVNTEDKGSKKASTRQKAIQEFMDSFESEFDIPPTRLVEAMAQLDDAELTQSPEETVDAVISQLGLDESQSEKARAMYASLLLQLQQTPQPPKPVLTETSLGMGLGPQSVQMRVDAAQSKQHLVQQNVQKLNASFMGKPMDAMGQASLENMQIDEDSFAAEQAPDLSAMKEAPANMPKMEELPPHLQGQMKDSIAPGLLAALAARKAEMAAAAGGKEEALGAEAGGEASADLAAEFSKALQSPKGIDKPLDPQALKAMMQNQGKMMQQDAQSQQSFLKDSNEFFPGMAKASKESAGESTSVKSGEFKHSLSGLEGLQQQPIKGETLRMDGAMPMAATPGGPVNPTNDDAAVKQLMNQAQYLIKKGGGEVKVEMTPEGMGTIHLKVMMQDGKVNLHMAADTDEAKKTIENGLAELKTSLAAHKLSVENVKIDVVSNVSTDTATQNQNQSQTNGNGGQRENRQFWNQFNENFGSNGRRESFTEMPGLKSYGRKTDPLQPIQTASKTRQVDGKGSGLNLVA